MNKNKVNMGKKTENKNMETKSNGENVISEKKYAQNTIIKVNGAERRI